VNTQQTLGGALSQWLVVHTLGRKPRTQQFNKEIVEIIRRQWPGPLNAGTGTITTDQVMVFAGAVSRYCPSRWNALVSALQFITPKAAVLERRELRSKQRPSLSQLEFRQLLAELDNRPRSHAGLVVRLLSQTGMRIAEARQVQMDHVKRDHFSLPASITKNGEPRCIPFLPGVRDTVKRLLELPGRAGFLLPQLNIKTALRRACRVLGLPKLCPHHDFRHLFTTRCIESKVDLPTVARWLGHQDKGALLAKRYFHLLDEHSRRMARKVRV
jgi:integrase